MRFCILSVSTILDDPRVRRQGDALHEDGHDVYAVGLSGGQSTAPSWDIVFVDAPSTNLKRLSTAGRGLAARFGLQVTLVAYWCSALHRAFYNAAQNRPADVVIANDWRVLPIAVRLARRWDARLHYDSHEYAVEERVDSRVWRLLVAPLVRRIEGAMIGSADTVSTVAEGIADTMQADYGLQTRPDVIRNTPQYASMPLREVHDPIRVLFQGYLMEDRGLEPLIRSVAAWRSDATLTIRGPAESAYRRYLERLINENRVEARVHLVDPARPQEMVRLANEHDVGIYTPSVVSRQMQFSLPNKLFEYMMAGLCVLASDLHEIRRVLDDTGAGRIIPSTSPEAIAAAVNDLDVASIYQMKGRALRAAQDLCWDVERARLLRLVAIPEGA